jgi:hypothetical protein
MRVVRGYYSYKSRNTHEKNINFYEEAIRYMKQVESITHQQKKCKISCQKPYSSNQKIEDKTIEGISRLI